MPAFIITLFILLMISESLLRFYQLRYSPTVIRLAYALYLLSPKKAEENIAINRHIIKGGFCNEEGLFKHYEKISGKPFSAIKMKFGRARIWPYLINRGYYSGGHGVIEKVQKMHLGLVPKANQRLQTLEINKNGRRNTGFEPEGSISHEKEKICLVLGNSVVFGAGATSDKSTIAGRIGYYLNKGKVNGVKFYVINEAISGANSLQELVCLLQTKVQADYVVSLSAFNDPDQAFFSDEKVSTWPRNCDRTANAKAFIRLLKDIFDRFAIFRFIKRFFSIYIAYDANWEKKVIREKMPAKVEL